MGKAKVNRIEVPVLIVGAGPTGLVASILLAQQGVRSLLVERHPGTSIYPRATLTNTRTMEIFRQIGVEAEVMAAGFDVKPRLSGSPVFIAPEVMRSEDHRGDASAVSPSRFTACSQMELEPILLERARQYEAAEVRYGIELASIAQDECGVTAIAVDRASQERLEINAQYMIGADGANSPTRTMLGIPLCAIGSVGDFVSINFYANLGEHLDKDLCVIHLVGGPAGGGIFIPTEKSLSRWVFAWRVDHVNGPAPDELTPEIAADLVRQYSGVPDLDLEVFGLLPWTATADVAESWRVGRIFLAGDAAHRQTPAAGLGMNTGMQDAHNLAWKLAAVLQGWGGDALLDTYEEERSPVAGHNAEFSFELATRHLAGGELFLRNALQVDLGFVYASTAVAPPPTEPFDPTAAYEPSTRPGARAPHAWIGDALSTLDLFGNGFTLLTAMASRNTEAGGAPVQSVALADERARQLYGIADGGAVLVRPDGHVAWRTADASGAVDLTTLLLRLTGREARVREEAA